MEKPVYFDGSVMPKCDETVVKCESVITDEVRKSISGNPFVLELKEEVRERCVML
ncbi:hypothetical protein ACFFJY_03035 [Fictibacillus aquaticus]|nr:hypothetical protein [Fictibacillus aquaticus]